MKHEAFEKYVVMRFDEASRKFGFELQGFALACVKNSDGDIDLDAAYDCIIDMVLEMKDNPKHVPRG